MQTSLQRWAYACLILLGTTLWLINWWYGRGLFIDEANVARNLFDRSFAGLFRPLHHQQYAGPIYLALTKACGEVLGYSERILRLPALLAGGLTVVNLCLAARRLQLGYWGLLPLALLFVNPTVLRYVGELKPYAVDLAAASTLVTLALRPTTNTLAWAVLGALLPWLSLPSVFVLAAVGPWLFWRARGKRRWRWVLLALVWLISFALLHHYVLAPSLSSQYLKGYHANYFLPLPGPAWSWGVVGNVLLTIPKTVFGYTVLAIAVGLLFTVLALIRRGGWILWVLLCPVVITLSASALELYSIIPRLILFMLPGWWLATAWAGASISNTAVARVAAVAWIIVLGSTNVVRHYRSPMNFSGVRENLHYASAANVPLYPSATALPAADYYARIHPRPLALDLRRDPPSPRFRGSFAVLFGLPSPTVGERILSVRERGRARGCQARIESNGLSSLVLFDCPPG